MFPRVFTLFFALIVSSAIPQIESIASPILALLQSMLIPGGQDAPLPPGYLLTKDYIVKEGFDYENYEVPTADGYLLQLHRILVHRKKKPAKSPILIMHGFLACSDIWLTRTRDKGFPFILVDEGFDVWLSDFRGNFYSRAHRRLKPEDPAFWNFTLHEYASYDIPALIDTVLAVTGSSKLFTLGHSMSGAAMLMTLAMKRDYTDKIHANLLFAPAPMKADASVPGSPVVEFLLNNQNLIKGALNAQKNLGIYEFMPRTAVLSEEFKKLCSSNQTVKFCLDAAKILFGDHPSNIDKRDLVSLFEHFPAGTSLKALWHMFQVLVNGFVQFDYDSPEENIKHYGTPSPPSYPLEDISSFLVVFYSDNDVFIRRQELEYLTKRLTGPTKIVHIPDPKFTHADFVVGLNAKKILFNPIISLMNSFNKNDLEN